VKIHEAEARELLARAGLPVPDAAVATTAAGARAIAERLFASGVPQVVIKAQVLVGGRGKAGGVKLAASAAEAESTAAAILALTIKDLPPQPSTARSTSQRSSIAPLVACSLWRPPPAAWRSKRSPPRTHMQSCAKSRTHTAAYSPSRRADSVSASACAVNYSSSFA